MSNATQVSVVGYEIEIDNSGVGHNWQPAELADCPASIQEEIAAEIIDGKRTSGEYKATNGIMYRW